VPITLADAPDSRGATWLPDASIVFTPTFGAGLQRVAAAGGAVEALSTPDPRAGEYSHRWPQGLPGARSLVFVNWTRAPQLIEHPAIALFGLESAAIHPLITDGEYAIYSPTGHLLYTRQGRLHAVTFDTESLRTVGAPQSITDVALVDHNTHAGHFAVSSEGTLVYLPGSLSSERTLSWVAADGAEVDVGAPPRAYVGARLSPERPYRRPPGPLPNYHLAPDGRFLMISGGEVQPLDHLNVVIDWLADISR
jgi:serine/threonine-protein kinase